MDNQAPPIQPTAEGELQVPPAVQPPQGPGEGELQVPPQAAQPPTPPAAIPFPPPAAAPAGGMVEPPVTGRVKSEEIAPPPAAEEPAPPPKSEEQIEKEHQMEDRLAFLNEEDKILTADYLDLGAVLKNVNEASEMLRTMDRMPTQRAGAVVQLCDVRDKLLTEMINTEASHKTLTVQKIELEKDLDALAAPES